jgi:hypothetical protein
MREGPCPVRGAPQLAGGPGLRKHLPEFLQVLEGRISFLKAEGETGFLLVL